MKIALYKGPPPRPIDIVFERLTSWWTRGPYTHVELVLSEPDENGLSLCGSSSFRDGGVRTKWIHLKDDSWDYIEVTGSRADAMDWFAKHKGEGYDVVGLFGFVVRTVEGERGKWFCSEAVMAALGFKESWRFSPNDVSAVFSRAA